MRFIGTGAGEGTPNPFCSCAICENARRVGGKEIRTRSSFRLDSEVIIDIGADFFAQSFMLNEPFYGLRHVLYTHTHDDHFNYTMIWERYAKRGCPSEPLNVYFTDTAYDIIDKFYLTSPVTAGCECCAAPENIRFVRLNFLQSSKIGCYSVTPLRGDHATAFEKNGANYLIENDDMKLFYAVDSGPFLNETLDLLSGKKLDFFIGECTFPIIGKDYVPNIRGHMDLNAFLKNLNILYDRDIIDHKTKIYLTHISPVGATHSQLTEHINSLNLPFDITVAYDGMTI